MSDNRDIYETLGPIETKCEAIARELRAGASVDAVRSKYDPDLHRSITDRLRLNEESQAKWDSALPIIGGYLYVFCAGEHLKIGMSELDVDARWRCIRSGNPLLEPPVYVTGPLGPRVREAERRAHESLSDHREVGEWFRCDRELAVAVVKRIEQEFIS